MGPTGSPRAPRFTTWLTREPKCSLVASAGFPTAPAVRKSTPGPPTNRGVSRTGCVGREEARWGGVLAGRRRWDGAGWRRGGLATRCRSAAAMAGKPCADGAAPHAHRAHHRGGRPFSRRRPSGAGAGHRARDHCFLRRPPSDGFHRNPGPGGPGAHCRVPWRRDHHQPHGADRHPRRPLGLDRVLLCGARAARTGAGSGPVGGRGRAARPVVAAPGEDWSAADRLPVPGRRGRGPDRWRPVRRQPHRDRRPRDDRRRAGARACPPSERPPSCSDPSARPPTSTRPCPHWPPPWNKALPATWPTSSRPTRQGNASPPLCCWKSPTTATSHR